MPGLVFCNRSPNIWRIATGSSLPPVLQHSGHSNIHSLAPHASSELTLGWGPGFREIRQTQGSADNPVYQHPDPTFTVRVRNIGGQERIYFSAGEGGFAANVTIYTLATATPAVYYQVDVNDITVPHPCLPGESLAYYTGDFAFGAGNKLFLSSGNLGGAAQAAIYEVSGAGANQVSGSPVQIYLGPGPIEGLCFVAPDSLYFMRDSSIYSLNLTTGSEQLEYDAQSFGVLYDIAVAPAGSAPLYVLKLFLAFILRFLDGMGAAVRKLAWGRGWRGDGSSARRA